MKKHTLSTWKDMGKKMKRSAGDKVVELQEDRSLFAQMMMVCESRPEINFKHEIGQYEFSVVPRSLFVADGTMHHCSMKSSAMTILEKLPVGRAVQGSSGTDLSQVAEPCLGLNSDNPEPAEVASVQMKVAIVDAMADLQSINKSDEIKTCAHLADHFITRVLQKYSDSDEVRLIF